MEASQDYIHDMFFRLVGFSPSDRSKVLACVDGPETIAEIKKLLDAHDEADADAGFLSPLDVTSQKEELVDSAVGELPEQQQKAFRLKYQRGRSIAEIAKEMETSETAIAGLIRQGLMTVNARCRCGE